MELEIDWRIFSWQISEAQNVFMKYFRHRTACLLAPGMQIDCFFFNQMRRRNKKKWQNQPKKGNADVHIGFSDYMQCVRAKERAKKEENT